MRQIRVITEAGTQTNRWSTSGNHRGAKTRRIKPDIKERQKTHFMFVPSNLMMDN